MITIPKPDSIADNDKTKTDAESFFHKHRKALLIVLGAAVLGEVLTWALVSQFSGVAAAHILFKLNWLGHTLNFVFIIAEAITSVSTIVALASTIKEADLHLCSCEEPYVDQITQLPDKDPQKQSQQVCFIDPV
jgi:hypothetical protein